MARPFEFDRFELKNLEDDSNAYPIAEFDGEWVKADDAIAREKANAAEIARLTALVAELTPAS
ncbi:hypothetical protein PQR05_29270 [Paraburkholderia sediminicola]|uniref:hypothetical protein n=1 Tax=Paraburkholderia sediminicola TaxID=458836 RepID=UPI0038B92BF3